MITDLQIGTDGAGFPILTWRESRGAHSPEWNSMARVECRIMKEAETGTLMFVVRGSARQGSFERGKPWQLLKSFPVRSAQELCWSPAERITFDEFLGRVKHTKTLLADTAQVVLAEFPGGMPLHVNCADASQTELGELELALTDLFVRRRKTLVGDRGYVWPLSDGRVLTYDPKRQDSPSASRPWYIGFTSVIVMLAVVTILGFIGWSIMRPVANPLIFP